MFEFEKPNGSGCLAVAQGPGRRQDEGRWLCRDPGLTRELFFGLSAAFLLRRSRGRSAPRASLCKQRLENILEEGCQLPLGFPARWGCEAAVGLLQKSRYRFTPAKRVDVRLSFWLR